MKKNKQGRKKCKMYSLEREKYYVPVFSERNNVPVRHTLGLIVKERYLSG